MDFCKCALLGIALCLQVYLTFGMSTHVSYYEHLTYDIYDLRQQHERSRRSVSQSLGSPPVELQFHSHGRYFDLHLVPDKTVFHKDLVIEGPRGEQLDPNLAHVYHGTLNGHKGSRVHGSIIDGIFRGVIDDPEKGKYYVEENILFFGGHRGESPLSGYRGHSVMYHESTVRFPKKYNSHNHCGSSSNVVMDRLLKYQNSSLERQQQRPKRSTRKRRELDSDRTTCLLFIQTDHVLYKEFPSTEVIVSKIAEHVKAANNIYSVTNFQTSSGEPIRNINFKVQRIRVNNSDTANDRSNPYRSNNIGVERFLDIVSMENHNLYCLAYVFTNRDFDNGVLGLAWVGSAGGSSGGICERYKVYSDRSAKSLNTGIVTFKNYGSIMPARVTHITFAHELGHNFGSPHDSGIDCTPGEQSFPQSRDGNFIMYPRATSGSNLNNNVFSDCSIRNISAVLEAKKDNCFVRSDQPICGNQIVDENEECDCGFEDTCLKQYNDTCCTPADGKFGDMRCKLKAGAQCSITEGACCSRDCTRKPDTFVCSPATDCQFSQTCNERAACPPAPKVKDRAEAQKCNNETQTCIDGECSGSICRSFAELEECECAMPEGSNNRTILCHTCCQRRGEPDTCRSTSDPSFEAQFENKTIFLHPGSACDDFNGYCDIFSNCRLVDADGPLSRLKQAIFNPELYSTIRLWIIEYWWAVLLMALALVLLMAGFIKVCSVHTPSSNPRLPKHKDFPGANTLRRRREHQQRTRQNRQQYEMAHRR